MITGVGGTNSDTVLRVWGGCVFATAVGSLLAAERQDLQGWAKGLTVLVACIAATTRFCIALGATGGATA